MAGRRTVLESASRLAARASGKINLALEHGSISLDVLRNCAAQLSSAADQVSAVAHAMEVERNNDRGSKH